MIALGIKSGIFRKLFRAHTERRSRVIRRKNQPTNTMIAAERLENRELLTADSVTEWNEVLLDAIRSEKPAPPVASRSMAIVHTAIFDAVNSIDRLYEPYLVQISGGSGASLAAAVSSAAHRTLVSLYPARTADFDAALTASLASIPDGPAETRGISIGQSVADQILALRSSDGASATVPYTPGTNPGDWRPTPVGFAPAVLPQWPNVVPFGLTSGDQFRAPAPPLLTSAEYAASVAEVQSLGSATSVTRTADQTDIAKFWAGGPGTATPPGQWNTLAQQLLQTQVTTTAENARLFALLNVALADAAIACWDTKYEYNFWRPVTAIREADSDGNAATVQDAAWTPLLNTPAFPGYGSGHSTFSSSASALLASFFGTDNVSFTVPSEVPGVADRSFTSFSDAAAEAGMSRIYGGIHFDFDNEQAQNGGISIGNFIADTLMRPVVRINAGGPELTGSMYFASDRAYQNGVGHSFGTSSPIDISGVPGGIPEELFQTVLWDGPGGRELQFSIPTANGGTYRVDLYFSEIWSGAYRPGARVFDVNVEGVLRIDNLDIYAEAGANKALKKSVEVTSDGILNIELLHGIQNPAIAGIVITELSAPSDDNTPPTISDVANQTINENTSTASLAFTVTDADGDPLTVTATSSNPALLPVGNIVISGSGNNRTVVATPVANGIGTAVVTLQVSDGQAIATDQFTLTVNDVGTPNTPPTISDVANQTINENTSTASLAFTVTDADGDPLTVTATSSNPALLPVGNIVISGSGNNRTVVATPVANGIGTAVVTLQVSDGQAIATDQFTLTVNDVGTPNTPPTISDVANQTINENTSTASLAFTVTDADGDPLTVTATSSNPALLPVGNIVISGSGSNRTVVATPVANGIGTAVVTLQVSDGQAIATDQFTLTVNDVIGGNGPPVISVIADQTMNGGTTISVPFTVTDPENNPLTVTVSASDSTVLTSVSVTGTGTNRTLNLTAGTALGESDVTVTVNDGSNTVTETLQVTASLRLNSGGPLIDSTPAYLPDRPYRNVGSDFSTSALINNVLTPEVVPPAPSTIPAAVFQTVAFDWAGGPEMEYDIPLLAGGSYQVDLLFSEIWSGAFGVGRRVFDVKIDGTLQLDNLDIFAEVGANTSLVKSFEITSDGNLDIELLHVIQNPAIAGLQITRLDDGDEEPTPGLLAEENRFVTEQTATVALGQTEGTRVIAIDVQPDFDVNDATAAIEDTFAIYLVDPSNPTQTLLDRGQPGTALFTLSGTKADYIPGLVRYDGTTVRIDVTSLGARSEGLLLFQLINSDSDNGSEVAFSNISSVVNPEGLLAPQLEGIEPAVEAGPALNLGTLSAVSGLQVLASNIHLDSTTGRYSADISLRNNGPALSRQTAVVFPGLTVGVVLQNPSGVDGSGSPYVGFQNAIQPGGLQANTESGKVRIQFNDPQLLRFALTPVILSRGPNSAPVLNPIGTLTVMPGQKLIVPLPKVDADADPVSFRIESAVELPTGSLGEALIFTPTPNDVGTYNFTLIASDGALETRQPVTLNVVADTLTTTRISGVILNTLNQPLPGLRIELSGVQTTTAADGTFLLDFGIGPFPGDTLKVHGEDFAGPEKYPFIAEKLPLMLEVGPFENINNVISRPIFLPALDIANADLINPNADTIVSVRVRPNESPVEVLVEQGTLLDQQGNIFGGLVSITEVPPDVTPAALPGNLRPDMVVTIQPGEMVFTIPAPVTFPNTAGYPLGQILDLWSINPVSGEFDDVGDMVVVVDPNNAGQTIIQTVSGGIRNSSWHFPAPPRPEPEPDDDGDEDDDCDECKETAGNFTVELHSGAVIEDHSLVTYQSIGQTNGLSLHYDSLRADPKPVVHIGYSNLRPRDDQRLIASLKFMRGDFEFQMPGYEGDLGGLQGGEHFWKLDATGSGRVALQADFSEMPSGVYTYELTSGPMQFDGTRFTGTTTTQTKEIRVVNSISSPFGAGWGLAGLQEIVENPDGSVLLVDGGGSELLFGAPASAGAPLVAPPGNFSELVKLPDGTYRQTSPDQTVSVFNAAHQIASTTDRNGNVWRFDYDASGIISRITDPAGLFTAFASANGRVTSITDPANRVTVLEYDSDGNLNRIVDPDTTATSWGYDASHRMISETDKRGFTESVFYDFAGRAEKSIRKDGGVQFYDPVQTQVLRPVSETTDPVNAPSVSKIVEIRGRYVDPNGNVTEVLLDKQGQARQRVDTEGRQGNFFRNAENLVTTSADGRGFTTDFTYDSDGNVLSITDRVGSASGGSLFVTGHDSDDHSNGEYQRAGLDFLTFGREATTLTEIGFRADVAIGYLGNSDASDNGAAGSGYTNRTFVDLDDAAWATTAFGGTFDILMIGTGGDYVTSGGSASLNAEAARFAEFFNAGGGIYVNTDQADLGQSFYNFLPAFGATQAAVGGTGVYSVTPDGQVIGLTEAAVDADQTHTEYKGVDTNLFRVFETHNQTGDPVAIGLFQGFIGGGLGGLATRFFTYDSQFNQATRIQDEKNQVTLQTLDPGNGNVDRRIRVVGLEDDATNGETDDLLTTYTYAAFGLIDTVTDPLGRITDYDYDVFGRTITVTAAKGTAVEAVTRFEYDTAGNQTSMIDGNGNRTVYEYDLVNRLIRTTESDPDGAGPLTSPVTSVTYDPDGNVLSTVDANGNSSQNEYDSLGRIIVSIAPDPDGAGALTSPQTHFTYDSAGNIESMTDPNGNVSRYTYDGRNRRTQMIDPDGGVTQFSYDSDNNLATFTDSVGNISRFTYDARDRLIEETDPLGMVIRYEYDGADNLVKKTDRNGRVTEFEYDDLHRLINERWLDSANVAINTVTYQYDAIGNLLRVNDSQSSLTFTYDARDRLKTVDNTGTPGAPSVILTYGYDDNSNVLTVNDTISGVAGATTGYNYDALDRLTALTQTGQNVSDKRVNFAYNALGQYSAIDRYSDLTGTRLVIGTDYAYDSQNRLTRIDHKNAANVSVAFYDYVYDAASRITRITSVDGVANYGYDDRDQLTSVNYTTPTLTDELYQYDANGNRVQSHLHGAGYVTDPNTANRLKSDGKYNYEYDNEGNMLRRTRITGTEADGSSIREFTWDYRNRLTAVVDKKLDGTTTQEVEFRYDAINRRISKAVDTTPTDAIDAVFTHFIYDREDVLMDFLDADGSGAALPTMEIRYTHGSRIDQVLAQAVSNGQSVWLLPDHLGTTRDIVDDLAMVKNHLGYDAFGNATFQSSPTDSTRYLFTGREFDIETGLWHYRARYLDAQVGIFLSEDRLVLDSYEHQYRYVDNRPTDLVDPSGRAVETVWDVANIVLGVTSLFDNLGQGNYGSAIVDAGGIGIDAAATLIPFIPGGAGATIKACRLADKLRDGMKVPVNKALDMAEEFLGKGYKHLGDGRFQSADGLRQVRMGDSDILGKHGGGPHINFENLAPNPAKPGKNQVVENIHVYLEGQ